MSIVSLSSSTRKTLNELQNVAKLLDVSSERITTGKKVDSAVDNPTNYFSALNYTDRSDSLSSRADSMQESVQVIKSADNGISSISTYLTQMQGIVDDAMSTTDSSARRALGEQYNEMIKQIGSVAQDSSYGGINLLSGNSSLTVEFGQNAGESNLTIDGVNIQAGKSSVVSTVAVGSSSVVGTQAVTSTDGTIIAVTSAYALTIDDGGSGVTGMQSAGTSGNSWEIDWGSSNYQSLLSGVSSQIEAFSTSMQTQSAEQANSLSIITTRENFTDSMITILKNGASSLTSANTEEEAANITSLQTSQELAVECLSLASQNAQNALSLIT
jgi:flagellin